MATGSPHNGIECPVHPLDVVEVIYYEDKTDPDFGISKDWCWNNSIIFRSIARYRHVCDEYGTPYVYDDGDLPEWAEYVVTCKHGCVHAVSKIVEPDYVEELWDVEPAEFEKKISDKYANTRIPWDGTLRRVWRED